MSNGWISATELVARIERSQHTPTADLVAGLLRLAPDGRDEAREAVTRPDELGDALRYALGGPPPEPSRPPGRGVRLRQSDLWVAASRARAPREGDDLPTVRRRNEVMQAVSTARARGLYEIAEHLMSESPDWEDGS